MFKAKSNNIKELKQTIIGVLNTITPEVLQNVSKEVYFQIEICQKKDQFEQKNN